MTERDHDDFVGVASDADVDDRAQPDFVAGAKDIRPSDANLYANIASADTDRAGEDLFSYLVGNGPDAGPPIRSLVDEPLQNPQLRDSVASVQEMTKNLEVQLCHAVSINEASGRDLEAARSARQQLEKRCEELEATIERMDRDTRSSGDLREEMRHMARESERLNELLQSRDALARRQADEQAETTALLDHLRSERDLLRKETDLLEAQLLEAAKYIAAMRDRDLQWRKRCLEHDQEMELAAKQLQALTQERDAMQQEVKAAREALNELQRAIATTSTQSQPSPELRRC